MERTRLDLILAFIEFVLGVIASALSIVGALVAMPSAKTYLLLTLAFLVGVLTSAHGFKGIERKEKRK